MDLFPIIIYNKLLEGEAFMWEYKAVFLRAIQRVFYKPNIIENQIQEQLNFYGKDGWELVSIQTDAVTDRIDVDFFCVFKRPK